jgi:hypothetical protein
VVVNDPSRKSALAMPFAKLFDLSRLGFFAYVVSL